MTMPTQGSDFRSGLAGLNGCKIGVAKTIAFFEHENLFELRIGVDSDQQPDIYAASVASNLLARCRHRVGA